MPSLVVVTSIPAMAMAVISESSRSTGAPVSVTSPPVIAAAMAYVPVSMRSAITECSAPCSRSTPWIVSVEVPMPSIRAPILVRQLARSATSGSRAAFSITVSPFARVAAMRALWVAPTETLGKLMRPPVRPPGRPPGARTTT
jgi:hypothetical protein